MNALKHAPSALLIAVVVSLLASGCQAPTVSEPAAPAPDYEAEHGPVAEAFREVWNTQDYDRFDTIATSDYQRIGPDANADGREAMKEFIRGAHAAYTDFHITFDEAWYGESSVAVVWTVTGTNEGKSVKVSGATVLEIVGGLIAVERVYYDRQTVTEQLDLAAVPHVSE
jgi:hypothetical protein